MAGVLYRLGRLCANRAIVVVAVWLGLVVVVQLTVLRVGAQTNNDLTLPGTGSQEVKDLLAERFPPQQNGVNPIVFDVSEGKLTDQDNKQAVNASVKEMRKAAARLTASPNPLSSAARPPACSRRTSRRRSRPSCWTSARVT